MGNLGLSLTESVTDEPGSSLYRPDPGPSSGWRDMTASAVVWLALLGALFLSLSSCFSFVPFSACPCL